MIRVEKCRICGNLYENNTSEILPYNGEDKTVCPKCRAEAKRNSQKKINWKSPPMRLK